MDNSEKVKLLKLTAQLNQAVLVPYSLLLRILSQTNIPEVKEELSKLESFMERYREIEAGLIEML